MKRILVLTTLIALFGFANAFAGAPINPCVCSSTSVTSQPLSDSDLTP